jgi:hypothetical protein
VVPVYNYAPLLFECEVSCSIIGIGRGFQGSSCGKRVLREGVWSLLCAFSPEVFYRALRVI